MPRRRRSQKPIASHVHWRQRVDSATAVLAGVRQLVLDVGVVALLGLERGHPVARRLGLARERHDRQELGLRLGQRLAGPDGGQVDAPQVGVDGVGGAPALGDRLDDRRRADPDVARPNTPGRPVSNVTASALSRRCLVASTPSEPGPIQSSSGPWPMASSTRSQGIVNSVPGAGSGRRRPDASGSPSAIRMNSTPVTLPFLSVTTRTGPAWKMAVTPSSIASWTSFDGGHVLHVAAVDERHLRGALADRRPRAVHRGEPAADDDDALAGVLRVRQAERRGPQVLEAVEHLGRVLAGDPELVRVVAADRDDDRVEALVGQVVEREVAAEPGVADDLAAQPGDRLVLGLEDLDLGQAVLRDAVAEHPAGRRVALEDRHVVAGQQQVERGGHAGRAGADDRGLAGRSAPGARTAAAGRRPRRAST